MEKVGGVGGEAVAPVCLGPPKCLDVIYNHTNPPCQVYFLCVITYCGEIVTPSAVFINRLLSTAMAISNKWKASYDSNRKYSTVANGTKHVYEFRRLLMDRRQLIVNCATATFYQELTNSQIMNKWRTQL